MNGRGPGVAHRISRCSSVLPDGRVASPVVETHHPCAKHENSRLPWGCRAVQIVSIQVQGEFRAPRTEGRAGACFSSHALGAYAWVEKGSQTRNLAFGDPNPPCGLWTLVCVAGGEPTGCWLTWRRESSEYRTPRLGLKRRPPLRAAAPLPSAHNSVPLNDPSHTPCTQPDRIPASHHLQAAATRAFPSTGSDRSSAAQSIASSIWMTVSERPRGTISRKPRCEGARYAKQCRSMSGAPGSGRAIRGRRELGEGRMEKCRRDPALWVQSLLRK
jgi:hypothetical protein